MARFEACGEDGGGSGVYDSAAGRWVTPLDLTESAAEDLAAALNARYDAYGERGPEIVRPLEQAIRVAAVREWKPAGSIDMWVRDRGEWYGRVCDPTGRVNWYPARDLRPTQATESAS